MIILLDMLLSLAALLHFANIQDNSWVDRLQNQQKNVCCFDNDGRRLTNPDWDTLGKVDSEYNGMSGYRVFEDGQWYEIPNWAVVTMKNQDGIARVWWTREYTDGKVIKKVRCFIPGALA